MESWEPTVNSGRWSMLPMTAAPDGALAPQGCAMDAAARPEPRAFGAHFREPGLAHLMLVDWGQSIRE